MKRELKLTLRCANACAAILLLFVSMISPYPYSTVSLIAMIALCAIGVVDISRYG